MIEESCVREQGCAIMKEGWAYTGEDEWHKKAEKTHEAAKSE